MHPRQRFVASDDSKVGVFDSRCVAGFIALEFPIFRRLLPVFPDPTDKAIASTMCGFNKARRFWIIVERFAQLADGDFEDGVADKSIRPDGLEQFLLGNQLRRPIDEIAEHGEGFWPDFDRFRPVPQALIDRV